MGSTGTSKPGAIALPRVTAGTRMGEGEGGQWSDVVDNVRDCSHAAPSRETKIIAPCPVRSTRSELR